MKLMMKRRLLIAEACLIPSLSYAAASGSTALRSAQAAVSRDLGASEPAPIVQVPPSIEGRAFTQAVALNSDFESLYVHGAIVADIYSPKDKYSRRISLKALPLKQENGELREFLDIYDITDAPTNVFSQQFPLDDGIKRIFQLDDRVPGKKEYTLKIWLDWPHDTLITFGRPGNEEQISTTLRRLLRKRAEQAIDEGTRIRINGREFYVIGAAGGGISYLLYFPGDLESKLDSSDPEDLAPSLGVALARVGTGTIRGPHPLGWVGERFYYVVYDKNTGSWVATEGEAP